MRTLAFIPSKMLQVKAKQKKIKKNAILEIFVKFFTISIIFEYYLFSIV
jgi:hypothetical protein